MTIDERLERLTERHETLTQTVELLAAENKQMAAENKQRDRRMAWLVNFGDVQEARDAFHHLASRALFSA